MKKALKSLEFSCSQSNVWRKWIKSWLQSSEAFTIVLLL